MYPLDVSQRLIDILLSEHYTPLVKTSAAATILHDLFPNTTFTALTHTVDNYKLNYIVLSDSCIITLYHTLTKEIITSITVPRGDHWEKSSIPPEASAILLQHLKNPTITRYDKEQIIKTYLVPYLHHITSYNFDYKFGTYRLIFLIKPYKLTILLINNFPGDIVDSFTLNRVVH